MVAVSPIVRTFILFAHLLAAVPVFAWTHGELLVSMDADGCKNQTGAPGNVGHPLGL